VRVTSVVLEKGKSPRLLPELPGLEKFDRPAARAMLIDTRLETLHPMDDQEIIVQRRRT
jgi:hypothetical protein